MIRAPSRWMPTPRAASYAPGRPRGPRLPHWLRHTLARLDTRLDTLDPQDA